jgi:hypothetical protein
MSDSNFKYFVKIQKAFVENGEIYVQGIASGILPDEDNEMQIEKTIDNFVRYITQTPLPLTDGHLREDAVIAKLGEVVEAFKMNDDAKSLFIKAKLDPDHPSTPYLVKKIGEGKRYAFSIEGWMDLKKCKKIWDKTLGKYVTRLGELIPKAISITSEPSYTPSFLEVVYKAIDKEKKAVRSELQEFTDQYNLLIKSQDMTEEEKTKPSEETTAEVVETSDTEVETKPEEVKSTEPVEDAETIEPVAQEEVKEDVQKSKIELIRKIATSMGYSDVELKQKAVTTVTKEYLDEQLSTINSKFDEVLEATTLLMKVSKSLHEDVELVKDLPLKRKSKAVVEEKKFEERAELPAGSQNFADNFNKLLGK